MFFLILFFLQQHWSVYTLVNWINIGLVHLCEGALCDSFYETAWQVSKHVCLVCSPALIMCMWTQVSSHYYNTLTTIFTVVLWVEILLLPPIFTPTFPPLWKSRRNRSLSLCNRVILIRFTHARLTVLYHTNLHKPPRSIGIHFSSRHQSYSTVSISA